MVKNVWQIVGQLPLGPSIFTFGQEFHMYRCMHAFAGLIASHHTASVAWYLWIPPDEEGVEHLNFWKEFCSQQERHGLPIRSKLFFPLISVSFFTFLFSEGWRMSFFVFENPYRENVSLWSTKHFQDYNLQMALVVFMVILNPSTSSFPLSYPCIFFFFHSLHFSKLPLFKCQFLQYL